MSNDTSDGVSGWDFGDDKKPAGNSQKKSFNGQQKDYDIFLKLKPRTEPFRVRLASNPKNSRYHWTAFKSISKAPIRSPAYSVDEKELDIAWAEGDFLPQRRHACLVFDRDDNNYLKILDGPDSLFSIFGNWFKAKKINPSSKDGTDWLLIVKEEGGKTVYSALPDDKTPFTPEEEAILANPPIVLDRIIKIKTPDEIKAMWMQLPDDKKYNPKSKYRAGKVFDRAEVEKRFGALPNVTASTAATSTASSSSAASTASAASSASTASVSTPRVEKKEAPPPQPPEDPQAPKDTTDDELPF